MASTRARKVATIRSFYKYLVNKARVLDKNPIKELDSPRQRQSLPRFLTLDEGIQLLESVDGENMERDFCIITLRGMSAFLVCVLRCVST
jgi:site-specific recombinase XerD